MTCNNADCSVQCEDASVQCEDAHSQGGTALYYNTGCSGDGMEAETKDFHAMPTFRGTFGEELTLEELCL